MLKTHIRSQKGDGFSQGNHLSRIESPGKQERRLLDPLPFDLFVDLIQDDGRCNELMARGQIRGKSISPLSRAASGTSR